MTVYRAHLTFSAVPKTATTYVVELLRGVLGSGSGGSDRHDEQHLKKSKGVRITLVRHPLTWIPSCYAWMVAQKSADGLWGVFPGPASVLSALQSGDIRGFVDNVIAHPGLVSEVFSPYTDHATHVFRTDRVLNELPTFLHSIGYDVAGIGKVNETEKEKVHQVPEDLVEDLLRSQEDFVNRWFRGDSVRPG